jgi:hypothetical protein
MFTLSEAATLSFDALRLLRMSRRGGVEGLQRALFSSIRASIQKTPLLAHHQPFIKSV